MHNRDPAVAHEIRGYDCQRCRDDQVVVAASRLQTELASRTGLEHKAFKLAPQQLAARRALTNGENSTPHGGAE